MKQTIRTFLFLLSYFVFLISSTFSQNVGIGTTSPITKLHIEGPNGNIATFNGGPGMWITIAETGANRGYIGSYAGNVEDVDFGTYSGNITGKLHLTTNNIPRLTLINNGNIGIGTTTPQQLFSVAGGMNIDQNDQNTGTVQNMLRFGNFSGEGIASKRNAGGNQYGLDFYTNSMHRMAISNAGNIGVGTSTPGEKLTVNGAINLGNTNNELPGTIRFNNSNNDFEGFDGTQWRSLTANGLFHPAQADTGFNQQMGDNFGFVVKILDDYLFVGAPGDDVGANNGQGSVTIYKKNPFNNKFEFFQWITSPNGAAGDAFGSAIAATVAGGNQTYELEYLIVGAPKKTVNGNAQRGAIYLFVRDYHTGQFRIAYNGIFSPADGAANDQFGSTLMVEPTGFDVVRVYAAAPGKTVNSNFSQGRVYVCRANRITSEPSQTEYIGNLIQENIIDAPNALPFGLFGYSIVQAPCYLLNQTSSVTSPDCNSSEYYTLIGAPGAVIAGSFNRGAVFGFVGTLYDTSIISSDGAANDNFGISIAIANKSVYIAASGKQIGGNAAQGKIYIYRDTATGINMERWFKETAYLTAADGQANDRFGYNIRMLGNYVFVSSINRDNPLTDAGSIYLFEKAPGIFNYNHSLRRMVTDPLAQTQSHLGKSLDLWSENFVIGVPDWDNPGRPNSGKIIFGTIY